MEAEAGTTLEDVFLSVTAERGPVATGSESETTVGSADRRTESNGDADRTAASTRPDDQ
jgi:ABC-2 type transport system ATP-binding protein